MEWLGLGEVELSRIIGRDNQSRLGAKPGLKINIYSWGITQTGTKSFSPGWYYQPGAGTKDPCPADDRWAGTFSPGWYYEPGLNGPLVPAAKNAEANAKLEHRSKVCSLVVSEGVITRAKKILAIQQSGLGTRNINKNFALLQGKTMSDGIDR